MKLIESNSINKHEIRTIKNEKKAFQYIKSAEGGPQRTGEEGNTDGQNKHGYFCLLGIGAPLVDEKTFQRYVKSAEGGSSGGQYSPANCYFYGISTSKNEKEALY
ncbi:hypothetical protein Glove_372g53 [Diversispora epigaea]|uniref:Uncharacterized protein n=1 Tax=Diversispora epigaea TaxID=1348612 RepID=A0A397H9Q3_9GLOM|nr:hypothetical protein Glove_372g53 [Diversispora epigaea]